MSTPVICVRCGAQSHPSVEHVCADVSRRYERRVRQRDAAARVLMDAGGWQPMDGRAVLDAICEDIVATLARMGVDNDGGAA